MSKQPTRRTGLRVVKRHGSASLYIRGTVRGIVVDRSAQTDDAGLAEEARAALEAEIYRGAIHGIKPATRFAAAVVSYLRHEERTPSTKVRIGRLLDYFGPAATCEDVNSQAALEKAAGRLCRRGSAPATRLREVISPARAVLTHAAERGWTHMPVFARVKAGPGRTDWMTPAEAEALIAAAADHLQPLIAFLFCTGSRMNEAITLDWSTVDLQNARCIFQDTKNGRDRIVDLPPRAVATLASLPGRQGRVFLSHSRQPYRATQESAGMSYGGQIKSGWTTALKGSGIGRPLSPHHCRHTWATHWYCVTPDPFRLREAGGWASISQVERYAKLAPAGMRDDIMAFWGLAAFQSAAPQHLGIREARE